MWAALPAKDLVDAKTRLADALSPPERRLLFRTMYEDVLDALARTPSLDGIAVITRDAEAGAVAQSYGARLIGEPENAGQTAAIERAAKTLAADGVTAMITIPGDTPLIAADEVETVIAAHRGADGDGRAMTIVPSHDDRGSNCIALTPPGLIPFSFGNDSFRPHLASASRIGVEPTVIELPGIGLDIDTPGDLEILVARGGDTRTHRYLESSGISARLSERRPNASKAGP